MVFDSGKLRNMEEQRALLESARVSRKRRSVPGANSRVRYDGRTDEIRIGNAKATVGEIISALAVNTPETVEVEREKSLNLKLSEAEHRMLKIRAAEAGTDMQSLITKVLHIYAKI